MGILRFAMMLRPYESMPHSIKAISRFKIINGHKIITEAFSTGFERQNLS